MKRSKLLAFGFVVLFATLRLEAQSTATLTGVLTDVTGGAIRGAIVTAERTGSSGAAMQTISGPDGRFEMRLELGEYRIRITHSSFAREEHTVTLNAGENRELRVRLELERLAATVVVTAQAEPVEAVAATSLVAVVTRQQIEERQTVWLAAALAGTPGISAARLGREGGLTSLFLDGGNSNFTKVLVDGATLNEPGGAIDFSNFTLDNVEKIEVVHGAASTLFGSDAMAGVVQIFTRRGNTHTPRFQLLAEGGSFSTARGTALLSGEVGRFDYSAAAGQFQTSGEGPNDNFRNTTLSGNFGWRFTETNRLRLSLRNQNSHSGTPGQTLFTPPNLDQENRFENFSANLGWEFQTGASWRHRLSGTETYIRQQFLNPLADFFIEPDPFGICAFAPRSARAVPTAQFCDFPFTAGNQFNRAGFAAQTSYLFRQGGVTAGYQYEVENGRLSALGTVHARRNNQAGYVEGRTQLGQRLTVNAGFRVEDNASFGRRVVPRFGVAYALRFGSGFWGPMRLWFTMGRGIKEPRLDQSFGADPCFPGNADLRPERSRTIHAGVEQRLAGDRVRLSGNYFDNRYRDIVSFTFCFPGGPCPLAPPPGCGFGFGTFFNTDLARARGTNVAIEAKPANWLSVSGSYSYVDSRVLQAPNAFDPSLLAGNRLFRRPVNSGNLILNASFHRMNWNLAGYFVGRRTDSDFLGLGRTQNPGYARVDFAGSYDMGRGVRLFGRIENLLDKSYQAALGYPSLGRAFRVGMKYTVGGE